MSARRVCNGVRPSLYISLRAISAPFKRPLSWILIPSAPMRMVEAIAIFTARRYAILPSSWRAILVATMVASSSGRLTSKMLICTSFLVIFFSSSFNLSTSCPPLPMMKPGRAVQTVTVTSFRVRSITIREILASAKRAFKYLRILVSSRIVSP